MFSLPALGNVGSVLFLFFFIYAVVGMNLFGAVKFGVYLTDKANFSNVAIGLLTLFRCITGESWNGIMQDCMIRTGCIEVVQVSARISRSGCIVHACKMMCVCYSNVPLFQHHSALLDAMITVRQQEEYCGSSTV